MTVVVVWHKPSDNELPSEYGDYYTVDYFGNHRIMTYHPKGGLGGMNWDLNGSSGGMMSNDEILKWTQLLP